MGEWRRYKIGEIAVVFDGPHATPKKTKTGPFFLSISSLSKGRLDLGKSARISPSDHVRWTRRVTPESGDVLFSYETRLGEAALMPPDVEACLGRRMGLLRPNRALVSPRFLLMAFLAPEFQSTISERSIQGATVDRIPLTELPDWPISIPDLATQTGITQILGALDDKIAVNERIAATAESLTRLVLTASPSLERVPVSDLAELSKAQVKPHDVTQEHVDHFSLPAFDSGCMAEHVPPSSIKSSKFAVRRPSVLVSKLNPEIPRVWVSTPRRDVPALASTEFLVLTPKEGVEPAELWGVIHQPELLSSLAARATGTSKSHQRVRPVEVMQSSVVDPRPLTAATRRARVLIARAARAREESRTLAELRDMLLPQLMSGKLRVREAEKVVEEAV